MCTSEKFFINFPSAAAKFTVSLAKDGKTEIFEGDYNPLGTVKKSLNLLEIYPEVTKIVERYGRIHHHVDFSKYKGNELKLRKGVRLPTKSNNYGMMLKKMTEKEMRVVTEDRESD